LSFVEPGADVPNGTPLHLKSSGPGVEVPFNYVFKGELGSVFNTLDVLRVEAQFARRFETNVDTDRIGEVHIGVAGSGPSDVSWFDPVMYTMNLRPNDRWRDDVILHEYGHYRLVSVEGPPGFGWWSPTVISGGVPGGTDFGWTSGP
jgi:hypothetical protein